MSYIHFSFDKVNENEGLINQCDSAYEHFVTQKIIHLSVLINVLISRRNRRLSRPQITYFRPKIWFRRKKKKKIVLRIIKTKNSTQNSFKTHLLTIFLPSTGIFSILPYLKYHS